MPELLSIFFIAAGKRNEMKCSLLSLTDTKLNILFYKLAREQLHIKNIKEFKRLNFKYQSYLKILKIINRIF